MTGQNFYAVERDLLENTIACIREEVLPQSNIHIRSRLGSAMGIYNETNGEFKALSATEFSDHDIEGFSFLIEVPAATCPEFVLEYLKNPFVKRIDPSEVRHHPLDKSKFSSVLKISTSMTMSLWSNLKTSVEARQVIKDFRVDFFISPEAYLVEPVADDSLLHILVTFNVSSD